MPDILAEAKAIYKYTQDLRRDFHRYPEIGFQEIRTAGIVVKELNTLGLETYPGIGKTGVVALIEGVRPGPVILLRFDMDALPVQEETGAEYASQSPGVMHACGHDAHVSIGLSVARLLNAHRKELAGTIKLVFQPAEEGLGGAEAMLAAGVLDNPRTDLALALHVWNEKPVGWFGISAGPVMAASEIFNVRIIGKGGHAAVPNLTIDPILASAQVITALQTIVSRNVPPLHTAVVSVTAVKGGEAFNVIPQEVELRGTIRTFDSHVRDQVLARFREIVGNIAAATNCRVEIDLRSITPALINDAEITRRVMDVAQRLIPGAILEIHFQTMGSEDMAYLMREVPGCYFLVGSANVEKGFTAPHHHPKFDIDEAVLPQAVALMTAAAMEFLTT